MQMFSLPAQQQRLYSVASVAARMDEWRRGNAEGVTLCHETGQSQQYVVEGHTSLEATGLQGVT